MATAPLCVKSETLTACPVCGGTRIRTILRSRDFESASGDYAIDECAHDHHRFTNPRPLESELSKLYSHRDTTDFVQSSRWVEALRSFAVRRFLRSLDRLIAIKGTILDYGAGDGFFTRELSKRYASSRVVGTDFHATPPPLIASTSAVQYLSNEEFMHDARRFDLIVLRHVLEHCLTPKSTIDMLHSRLTPGGVLVIEVPNRESVWAQVFGSYYSALYLPRHLSHFSRRSLLSLLGSFTIVKASAGDIPLIGKSLGNLSGLPIGNVGVVGMVLYPLQLAIDRLFGRSSTLVVVARKVS